MLKVKEHGFLVLEGRNVGKIKLKNGRKGLVMITIEFDPDEIEMHCDDLDELPELETTNE